MIIAKIKPVLLSAAALAVIATSLVVQHRSEVALRRENEELRGQLGQLAQLQEENERLSDQLVRLQRQASLLNEHRELLRLRGQVGLLRDQSNQLREEVATLRRQNATGLTSPAGPPPGKQEIPEINYSFQRIPLVQLLSIYEDLCGKKLSAAPGVNLAQGVHLQTDHPLTTNGAMRFIEDALKEQASVMIVPVDDATLSVVPAARVTLVPR